MKYFTLGLLSPDEKELSAYAVYYLTRSNALVVVDFLAANEEGLAEDLLAAVVRQARCRGANSICCELAGANPLETTLRRFGFLRRHYDAPQITFFAAKSTAVPVEAWYFLRGDEDYN